MESRMMPELYTYAIRYLERRVEECTLNGNDDIAESYKVELEKIKEDRKRYLNWDTDKATG